MLRRRPKSLNQACEHALDGSSGELRFAMRGIFDVSEPTREAKLELELHRGRERDSQVPRELARAATAATLRYVAADRHYGSTHLLTQAELLVSREPACELVHEKGELFRLHEYTERSGILHSRP